MRKNTRTVAAPSEDWLERTRYRARILILLEAAERAGISPIAARRLHAFAYLADVLSPVWDLPAFDGKILKLESGPYYPDLQREIDALVVLGLVNVVDLGFVKLSDGGARIAGSYALRFDVPQLRDILSRLGSGMKSDPLDPQDRQINSFLVELAGALSTLPDDEVDIAASVDATYADPRVAAMNIVDFAAWSRGDANANLSAKAVTRFDSFLPTDSHLSRGEKLYVYASYLRRHAHGS